MIHVTEVIDYLMEPELFNWYMKNGKAKCQKIGDEAKRIGTAVDLLVQQDIKDGGYLVPEGDESITNCLKAWESFKKDNPWFLENIASMQLELTQGELVGHPDFIVFPADKTGIIDLKCSSGIRPRYWTQTAKYLDMLGAKSPKFIAIIRLDKVTGRYEYAEICDEKVIDYEVKVFEAYFLAYKHNETIREIIRQQLEAELLGG